MTTLVIAGSACALMATAQPTATTNAANSDQPPAAAPVETKPTASPDDLKPLAFLAGAWSSDSGGSLTEEHWSSPHGTSIMGMFRWCKPDGTPSMFEILTITAEPEGVLLRLRHYSPVLVAKEDKDKPLVLKLDSVKDNKAVFVAHADTGKLSRITYHAAEADRLSIDVAFSEESKRPPLRFNLKRQGSKG
ncbi:MAG: hypothetical protein K2W85_08280 [Phycisphaerales bacterium]|nr:hypothetical protein [Phycisphaerales bacterium]